MCLCELERKRNVCLYELERKRNVCLYELERKRNVCLYELEHIRNQLNLAYRLLLSWHYGKFTECFFFCL